LETQDFGRVIYEKDDGGVARLIMNYPERANLQDSDMVWAFDKALSACEYDYDVKVLIIKSNAKGFCGGHVATGDYPEFHENRKRTGTTWQAHTKLFLHPVLRLWEFPKPTIAQVHGYAVGGGSYWALLPDITVASEDAWFQMPHAYLMGLPGAETMIEPWIFMNYKRTAEYIYLRKKIPASEALELGMINRVVPRAELEETVEGMAREIAMCPVTTLTAAKLLIKRAWELMGFRLHQQWSADMTTTVTAHTDFREHLHRMMAATGGTGKVE
jgi:enoyl-CoA hydratase